MKKTIWMTIVFLFVSMMLAGCFSKNHDESLAGKDQNITTTEDVKDTAKTENETDGANLENKTEDTKEDQMQNTEDKEPVTEEVILDETKAVKMWITASSLNLRKTPDKEGIVLKVLKRGTELLKFEELDGWALVKAGDMYGYVSEQYLADEKPEEPTTVKQEETTTSKNEQGSTSKVEAIPGQHRNPNSAVVVIDPGHQRKGDSTKEANGPGSSTMKARVTYGTTGVATGVTEYILNLDVSMKLKAELENRGYTVYMTRTSHDVNMSNKERAEYGNSVGADAVIRIHANSSDNSSVRGAETLSPFFISVYFLRISPSWLTKVTVYFGPT